MVYPDPLLLFLSEIRRNTGEPVDPMLVRRCMDANESLIELMEGEQDIEQHFDILEATGHDMDATLDIYEENLRFLGLW